MVIWVTGLSGAGKTTLCRAVEALVKPRLPELVLLDGDVVRGAFGDLGYHEADRVVQVRRLQALAKALAEQDLAVMVACLYAHPDLLAWNRDNLPGYFEVYVRAPLELVRKRDSKGLYRAAFAGETENVVGVDIPWHAPERPDIVIDTANGETPEDAARRLACAVPRLAAALLGERREVAAR